MHIEDMGGKVRLLIKYYDQGVAVFILTDRQRKEQKPDTKKIRKLNKFNYHKML